MITDGGEGGDGEISSGNVIPRVAPGPTRSTDRPTTAPPKPGFRHFADRHFHRRYSAVSPPGNFARSFPTSRVRIDYYFRPYPTRRFSRVFVTLGLASKRENGEFFFFRLPPEIPSPTIAGSRERRHRAVRSNPAQTNGILLRL